MLDNNVIGKIHSIETFGTVDGPGVRMVLFLQGCPMRCAYCHNPDTWKLDGGKEMSVEEILKTYKQKEAYYQDGGITISGGEATMQLEFLHYRFQKSLEQKTPILVKK